MPWSNLYLTGNLTDGHNKISVANIASKSELPTKTSQLTNNSGFVTSTELSTVATSGSYNDLTDKPTIPTTTSQLTNDSNFITSTELATKQDKLTAGTGITIDENNVISSSGGGGGPVNWSDILNKPTFATVATSGSYNDLSDKPTIPTTTSQLTNDSNFVTSTELATKQDKLVAGTNITIEGNVISAAGGSGGSGGEIFVGTSLNSKSE